MKIRCSGLSKAYAEQAVLQDFSVDFADTGFYLLLGESGSGKTTLLNLLAGFLPFGAGSIAWGEESYTGQVDTSQVEQHFDYITQDAFFVDFLSARDNLRLVSQDEIAITQWMSRFGMEEKGNQQVTTLSGGEKQRLALIRAMLKGKKVLFLDEPTAALDEGNKQKVFAMLQELSHEVLIICATHDTQAVSYADHILRFRKPARKILEIPPEPAPRKIAMAENGGKKAGLSRFLSRWFHSRYYNRRVQVLFTLFLALALCLCMAVDTPEHKLESSLEHIYEINLLTLETFEKTPWEEIDPKDPSVKEVVISYGYSLPDGMGTEDIFDAVGFGWDTDVHAIAFEKENCRLSQRIKYGSWFTKWDQVILSWEMASSLAPSDPESLIGQTIRRNLYGIGQTDLEIVGIFDTFREDEKAYLEALDIVIRSGEEYNPVNYSDLYFVSGKLMDKIADDHFYSDGSNYRRGHQLYFDSFRDMKAFYDRYSEEFAAQGVYMHYDWITNLAPRLVFHTLYTVYLPLAFFLVLFATVFFILLVKTEFVYNNRFISVFAYAGFSKKRIISTFIGLHLWQLVKSYLAALVIAFCLTAFVNYLNKANLYVNFQIFSYNPVILGVTLCFMLVVSFGFMNLVFRRVRVSSWYESLIASRDLI